MTCGNRGGVLIYMRSTWRGKGKGTTPLALTLWQGLTKLLSNAGIGKLYADTAEQCYEQVSDPFDRWRVWRFLL